MNGSVNYVVMKCKLSALEMRSLTAGNRLFPLWYHHTPRADYPSTRAEGLCAVLASSPENDQEIKTSLLSIIGEIRHQVGDRLHRNVSSVGEVLS